MNFMNRGSLTSFMPCCIAVSRSLFNMIASIGPRQSMTRGAGCCQRAAGPGTGRLGRRARLDGPVRGCYKSGMSVEQHKEHAPPVVRVFCLTVSDTRTEDNDTSGHLMKQLVEA